MRWQQWKEQYPTTQVVSSETGWYRDYVASGARQQGLPPPYVRRIEAVPARADPDPLRAAVEEQTLLSGGSP